MTCLATSITKCRPIGCCSHQKAVGHHNHKAVMAVTACCPLKGMALISLWGSFAQRYVKRHAPVRERAETRRLHWFLSPDFKAVFWGRPPTESGTLRRTRRTPGAG